MSKTELDTEREAALAQLTDEERAALAEDDLTPEERAAMQSIADEGDDDGDDDGDAAEAKPAESAKDGAAEDGAAVAAADESADEEQFRPTYKVDLPADFDVKVHALDDAELDLAAKFKAGEVELEQFLADGKRIAGERRELDAIKTKAEIAGEMGAQTAEQEWFWNVRKFMRDIKKAEGIDYTTDAALNADFDSFVRVLAGRAENNDKSMEWFLSEAHKRTKALHGVAAKPAEEVTPKKLDAKASRKPPLAQIPASLAQVPGGDGPGDVSDEFTELDSLDGIEYEQALAKMTTAQRERYLAAA